MARRQQLVVGTFGSQTGFFTGDLALNTGRAMLHRPLRSALFLVGIVIFAFAKGLTPPADRLQAYESRLPTVAEADAIARLEAKVANAYDDFKASQGWFWSCSGPCVSRRARYENLAAQLEESAARWRAAVSDAKAELGPFSEQAVSETRDYFWSRIREGWRLATQFTTWDAVFSLMSRDESFAERVINLLFRALSNLAVGMGTAVFGFIIGVWGVISTYQPTAAEGVAMFAICTLAALSWLVLACTGIVAVVVVPVAVVTDVARLTGSIEDPRMDARATRRLQHSD